MTASAPSGRGAVTIRSTAAAELGAATAGAHGRTRVGVRPNDRSPNTWSQAGAQPPAPKVRTWRTPLAKQATAPGATSASVGPARESMQPRVNPAHPGPWRQTAKAGCA